MEDESILLYIKKRIGLADNYNVFDKDIVGFINNAIWRLHQIGVGKAKFFIKDEKSKWSDFLGDDESKLESVKTYVYLKTKLIFDPPANSFLVTSINEQIKELEWELNVEVDPSYE